MSTLQVCPHRAWVIAHTSLIGNLWHRMLKAGVGASLSLLTISIRGTSAVATPSFTERDAALLMQGGSSQEYRIAFSYGFTSVTRSNHHDGT